MNFSFIDTEFSGKDVSLIESGKDRFVMFIWIRFIFHFFLKDIQGFLFIVGNNLETISMNTFHFSTKAFEGRDERMRFDFYSSESFMNLLNIKFIRLIMNPVNRQLHSFGCDIRPGENVLHSMLICLIII